MLDALKETLICPVCLGPLPSSVVQCQRGHALCQDCIQDQKCCPMCRQQFLPYKPTLLSQILRVMGQCKFRDCKYTFKGEYDHHYRWCGYQPTECYLCNWSGPGRCIINHVLSFHSNMVPAKCDDNVLQILYDCILSCRSFYKPGIYQGSFFWIHINPIVLSTRNSSFLLVVEPVVVPTGKVHHNLNFKIKFVSDACTFCVTRNMSITSFRGPPRDGWIYIQDFVLGNKLDLVIDIVECETNSTETNTGGGYITQKYMQQHDKEVDKDPQVFQHLKTAFIEQITPINCLTLVFTFIFCAMTF